MTALEGARAGVELTAYPYFPGTLMTPDSALLDDLAARFVGDPRDANASDPAMTRFLFGAVPVEIFDVVFAATDPSVLPLGAYLWLFHLSGYYGGVWLRGELITSGHNTMIANVNLPPNEEAFRRGVDDAAEGFLAASGADVLAHNEQSLFDQPAPTDADPAATRPGLVDSFGYNEGYLLQIVERPPAGLRTPTGFVSCPPAAVDGPLSCEYRTSVLAATTTYAPVAAALARGDAGYGELAARIAPVQEPAIARGRAVWDGALNVEGFTQVAYEQLLDISSAFLETVQATALATVRAVVERDERTGRRALVANALMTHWLLSYIVGLTDGRDVALPSFSSRT